MGAEEANFLGGLAKQYGVKDFDPTVARKRFFQIFMEKVLCIEFLFHYFCFLFLEAENQQHSSFLIFISQCLDHPMCNSNAAFDWRFGF